MSENAAESTTDKTEENLQNRAAKIGEQVLEWARNPQAEKNAEAFMEEIEAICKEIQTAIKVEMNGEERVISFRFSKNDAGRTASICIQKSWENGNEIINLSLHLKADKKAVWNIRTEFIG